MSKLMELLDAILIVMMAMTMKTMLKRTSYCAAPVNGTVTIVNILPLDCSFGFFVLVAFDSLSINYLLSSGRGMIVVRSKRRRMPMTGQMDQFDKTRKNEGES